MKEWMQKACRAAKAVAADDRVAFNAICPPSFNSVDIAFLWGGMRAIITEKAATTEKLKG